jgi:hypothetical protein
VIRGKRDGNNERAAGSLGGSLRENKSGRLAFQWIHGLMMYDVS